MKHLLIIVLLAISTCAMAQSLSSGLRTRISDDGQTLSSRIDGRKNGRPIRFSQTFDITNMNGLQQAVLKYRVFNNLGLTVPFREVPWLIFATLGALGMVITCLIVVHRYRKVALVN